MSQIQDGFGANGGTVQGLTTFKNGIVLSNANSAPILSSDVHNANLLLVGDTGTGSGGEIRLFGTTHATAANQTRFYNNGTLSLTIASDGTWTLAKTLTMSGANIALGGNNLTGLNAIISNTANPSSTGIFRMANVDPIGWRNGSNNGDLTLGFDSSNRLNLVGALTASTASAGSNGAVPAQVSTYLVLNLGGTNYKIPLFAN